MAANFTKVSRFFLILLALLCHSCSATSYENVPVLSVFQGPMPSATPTPSLSLPECDYCAPPPPQALPQNPPATLSQINHKIDLWRGGTTLRGANIWQAISGDAQRHIKDWLSEPYPNGRSPVAIMETNYAEGGYSALKTLRNWGANYVNVSFPGIATEKPVKAKKKGKEKETYQTILATVQVLKEIVKKARENQLFVVIAIRTGPGRSEKQFSEDSPQEMVHHLFKQKDGELDNEAVQAQNAWVAMWTELASEIRHEPNVIGYNLMAEPGTATEDHFDHLSKEKRNLWTSLARRLVSAIRDGAGDKETPILIGGTEYSEPCSLYCMLSELSPRYELKDNVVYDVHQYKPDAYTHLDESDRFNYRCSNNIPVDATLSGPIEYDCAVDWYVMTIFRRLFAAKSANKIDIAISETGAFRVAPKAPEFLNFESGLIERLGANYALWNWEPDTSSSDPRMDFRLGSNPLNTAKLSSNSDDPLIKEITREWSRNRIFAEPEILSRFDKNDPIKK